jgi:RHS repeat-associated protein
LLASTSAEGIHWALEDHEGTIRDVVADAAPTVIADHRKFDAFGAMAAEPLYFPQAYTGRPWDAAAGMYDYRARWYDPATGRFAAEDPSGFSAGDPNLYRYVGNDPLNNTDPTGLCGWGNTSSCYSNTYQTSTYSMSDVDFARSSLTTAMPSGGWMGDSAFAPAVYTPPQNDPRFDMPVAMGQSVAVPPQQLHAIAAATAEHEQVARQRIVT